MIFRVFYTSEYKSVENRLNVLINAKRKIKPFKYYYLTQPNLYKNVLNKVKNSKLNFVGIFLTPFYSFIPNNY